MPPESLFAYRRKSIKNTLLSYSQAADAAAAATCKRGKHTAAQSHSEARLSPSTSTSWSTSVQCFPALLRDSGAATVTTRPALTPSCYPGDDSPVDGAGVGLSSDDSIGLSSRGVHAQPRVELQPQERDVAVVNSGVVTLQQLRDAEDHEGADGAGKQWLPPAVVEQVQRAPGCRSGPEMEHLKGERFTARRLRINGKSRSGLSSRQDLR